MRKDKYPFPLLWPHLTIQFFFIHRTVVWGYIFTFRGAFYSVCAKRSKHDPTYQFFLKIHSQRSVRLILQVHLTPRWRRRRVGCGVSNPTHVKPPREKPWQNHLDQTTGCMRPKTKGRLQPEIGPPDAKISHMMMFFKKQKKSKLIFTIVIWYIYI